MLGLRLPRKACDQRRPQGNPRNFPAELFNHRFQVRPACPPAHTLKDVIAGMLDWQIQIFAYLLLIPDHRDQFIGNFPRDSSKGCVSSGCRK